MAKRKIVPAILMLTLGMVLMTRSAQADGLQAGGEGKQLVTWELELAGGVKAKLTAANGELVRLTREDGSELAFIPEIVVGGPTRFKVFEVVAAAGGGKESLRPVDVMEVGPGEEAYSKKVSGLTMRLAQGAPRSAREGAPVKAGVPPSDMLVRWDLTLPSGRVVKVVSREGEMTRLKMPDGQFFGFVPAIHEEGAVSFRLFSLSRVQGVGEVLSPIETFDVQPGSDYFPRALSSSLVKLTDVRRISPADREALSKLMSGTPGGGLDDQCCITCSGTKLCGCAVDMDCGSCCVPPCCFEAY